MEVCNHLHVVSDCSVFFRHPRVNVHLWMCVTVLLSCEWTSCVTDETCHLWHEMMCDTGRNFSSSCIVWNLIAANA